jgi:hypothetical protein
MSDDTGNGAIMMRPKIGQKVLCISDDFDPAAVAAVGGKVPHKVIWPVVGRQYTIADIRRERPAVRFINGCTIGFVLEELPHPMGFDARAFMPINNEKTECVLEKTERAL